MCPIGIVAVLEFAKAATILLETIDSITEFESELTEDDVERLWIVVRQSRDSLVRLEETLTLISRTITVET